MSKRPVITARRRTSPYSLYGPFTWFRAKKDGRPFLKIETTTWWDVNGFLLQTTWHRITVEFKRRGRSTKRPVFGFRPLTEDDWTRFRITWCYATKKGLPLFKTPSSVTWRDINGVYLRMGKRLMWVEFRRRGR